MTENKTPKLLTVAAIQMNSGESVEKNLDVATKIIESIESLPDVIVLPELFNYRSQGDHSIKDVELIHDKTLAWLKSVAKKNSITIIGGSIIESSSNKKSYNTTMVVNSSGGIQAQYRKIHLL